MDISQILQDLQQNQAEGGSDWQALASAIQTNFSSQKTPLGLNQWQPDDKPRMEHFNEDNRILDQLIRELREELTKKANLESPAKYDVKFNQMVKNANSSKFWKNQFGEVTVYLFITTTEGKILGASGPEVIGSLPEGFRPSEQVIASVATRIGTNRESGAFHFRANGDILYSGKILSPTEHAWGSISFLAAN